MHQQSWVYEGASSDAWGSGGIGVFRTRGLVLPATSALVLADAQCAVCSWGLRGMVASYEAADMRIEAERLLDHALTVVSDGGGLKLPTALVVRADDMPMWRIYAELMARNGILRGVFTSQDAAMTWARRQAAVFEADRRHQSRESGR